MVVGVQRSSKVSTVQIDREANIIAKETRRGKGNVVICSSDVATALAAAGTLDYSPAMASNLQVDDTGNTFAGLLNGRYQSIHRPICKCRLCNSRLQRYKPI